MIIKWKPLVVNLLISLGVGIISGAGSTVMAYASPKADCERIAKAMVDVFAANNEHACYHILDLDTDGVKKV